jgi:hypothetical protein
VHDKNANRTSASLSGNPTYQALRAGGVLPKQNRTTIYAGDMGKSFPSLSFLMPTLLSMGCLYLLILAGWYRRSESRGHSSAAFGGPRKLDLILVAASQLLYIFFGFAHAFHWMIFYPGNPVETVAIVSALVLCIAGTCVARFQPNSYSFITIVVAIVSGAMWLLAAIGSVAI